MSNSRDAVATMGAILPDDAGGRDAVHVAVFSATSAEQLYPGQHVGLTRCGEPDCAVAASASVGPLVGVVDPFIKSAVYPGQRFWVYLYPRTITALSHRWSHPALDDEASTLGATYATPSNKLTSEKWLRDFSEANCLPYADVINAAVRVADGFDDRMTIIGTDASADIPSEFWHHAAIVLGRSFPAERPAYFSCSC